MAMMTVSNGRCLTGVAAPEDWEVEEGEDAVDCVGGRRGVASGNWVSGTGHEAIGG